MSNLDKFYRKGVIDGLGYFYGKKEQKGSQCLRKGGGLCCLRDGISFYAEKDVSFAIRAIPNGHLLVTHNREKVN